MPPRTHGTAGPSTARERLSVSGFAPEWLAARDPYDVAALDEEAIGVLRAWAERRPDDRTLRVVDLGCGTGAGLRRALGWLSGRPVQAYAVDSDPALLAKLAVGGSDAGPAGAEVGERSVESRERVSVAAVVADLLGPLDAAGGPPDGTVDLVVSHAVADLLPLDRFAGRVPALLRPGGIAHVALTYDGVTAFDPVDEPALDRAIIGAYHRHMDLGRRSNPMHGGSSAGRRLVRAMHSVGLSVVRAAPSIWDVRASDGPDGKAVLAGLLDFVTRSLTELDDVPAADVRRWELARRAQLAAGTLRCRVHHRDVLAARMAPEASTGCHAR
jgi:SAM-dependent methyltransferase